MPDPFELFSPRPLQIAEVSTDPPPADAVESFSPRPLQIAEQSAPDIFSPPGLRIAEVSADPPPPPVRIPETSAPQLPAVVRTTARPSALAEISGADEHVEQTPERTVNLRIARAWGAWVDNVFRALRFLTKPGMSSGLTLLAPSVDETDVEWRAIGTVGPSDDPVAITLTLVGESRFPMQFRLHEGGAGYTSAPNVLISGKGGTGKGATAIAYVHGGAVVALEGLTSGYGYTEPLSVSLTGGGGDGALVSAKIGRQFGVGDFILWNDPTENNDSHSYEIDKITDLKPLTDSTMEVTLERHPQGGAPGFAQFGSVIREHTACEIYRLIPKWFQVPSTAGPQVYKYLWENMCVAAVQGFLGGVDAGTVNLADKPLVHGSGSASNPRTAPPSPGYRTFSGYAYEDIGFLGTLEVGVTAIARISTQAWETVRSVYAKVVIPPEGGQIVVRVCFVSPPDLTTGVRTAALLDTLTIAADEYQSYPRTNQPDGRLMPYHDSFPLSGSRKNWPPTRLPVIIDGLNGSGQLQVGTIDPTQTIPFVPDGQIDFIVLEVGSVTAGTDLIVTVQT